VLQKVRQRFRNLDRDDLLVDLVGRVYRSIARTQFEKVHVHHARHTRLSKIYTPPRTRKVLANDAKGRMSGSSVLESSQAPPPFRRVRTGANLTDRKRLTPRVHEEQWTGGV